MLNFLVYLIDMALFMSRKIGKTKSPALLWTRFFDHPLMDLLMLGLAALAPFLYRVDPNLSLAFLVTSAGFELTGYIYAVGLVCKSGIWKKWFVSSDEQTTKNLDDD